MALKVINTCDRQTSESAFTETVVSRGMYSYGFWRGFATLKAGVSYASVDIIRPSQHRGSPNNESMLIYANSRISGVRMINRGAITLGAATGKIKCAPTLANATAALYVESAAAASNTLAVPAAAVEQLNFDAATTVGSSNVTYRLFATDGGAAGAAAASTMSVTTDTIIDVEIGFITVNPFGSREDFGFLAPTN
jgi:hypothetical protein